MNLFFSVRVQKCGRVPSLEIHQVETLFEGISKSINVAQTGSGIIPSAIITFLMVLKTQSA